MAGRKTSAGPIPVHQREINYLFIFTACMNESLFRRLETTSMQALLRAS
jgi:hypothetical protein